MKNTFCDVIRDLLPLYAENMVSESSKNVIEEHFCECESCKNEYKKITADVKITDTNNENIVKLKKEINKKSAKKAVIATLMGIFSIVLITVLLVLIFKPYFFTILYPGDRITLNINCENEGYPIVFNEHDVTTRGANNLNNHTVKINNNTTVVSVEADEYGRYDVNLKTYSNSLPMVNIVVDHFNWWEIYNCDLDISIDSDTELLTYTYTASKTLENGTMDILKNEGTSKIKLDDNNDQVYHIYLD